MLNQKPQQGTQASKTSLLDSKPGSEPAHANLPHDFGADVNDATERQYASRAALNQDPGHIATRSNDERDGRRDAGVGVNATNAGAGSGGDLDTDVIGLDGRGGVATNFPDAAEREADGPDRHDPLATPRATNVAPLNANDDVRRGGTVTIDRDVDADGRPVNEGNDAINTTSSNDPYVDGATGEISRGESAGPGDSSSSSARR